MRYLYIDTSSSYLYSAIVDEKIVLSEIKKEYGQNLSKVALPEIANLFKKTNLNPKDIDKIIVVNGPGSFTGIRIGITIAKVYAWTLSLPITTITSLEAMTLSSNSNKLHVPLLNARRGYVYTAIYDENNKEIFSPKYMKLDALKSKLKNLNNYEFISNDEFDEEIQAIKYNPNIYKIVNYFKNKKNISPHAVNPNYLKLTEAEESRKWL